MLNVRVVVSNLPVDFVRPWRGDDGWGQIHVCLSADKSPFCWYCTEKIKISVVASVLNENAIIVNFTLCVESYASEPLAGLLCEVALEVLVVTVVVGIDNDFLGRRRWSVDLESPVSACFVENWVCRALAR